MSSRESCVIGVDAGGTSTRVVVASREGVIGWAVGPGSNPISLGYAGASDVWVSTILAAMRDCTVRYGAAPAVEHCVIAAAGSGSFPSDNSAVSARIRGLLNTRMTPTFVSDVTAAYASATSASEGLIVLSGTGAVAARIRSAEIVDFADGHGWLVGDVGSGYWIGARAARAALDAMQGGEATALRQSVVAHAGVPNSWFDLVKWIYEQPVRGLSALAPSVVVAARDGDGVANQILAKAARGLLDSLARLRPRPGEGPVVIAGSVATSAEVVFQTLSAGIADRWGMDVVRAADGLDGVVRLAWRAVDRALEIS